MNLTDEIPKTINAKRLRRLPIHNCPSSFKYQRGAGNGCSGDPPGYPTYFTKSVYTRHGNTPSKGTHIVLFGRTLQHSDDWKNCKDWDEVREKRDARIKALWVPLPLDHPRTIAWINATFSHHRHCYQDPTINGSFSDKTLIFPVPSYKLKEFTDDVRFSDEWRTKEKASIEQANKEIIEHAERYATPENHSATIIIRRYYPEFQPTPELLTNPQRPGNWWERLDGIPKPEDCPGQYDMKHPVNGTWCQMCGWKAKEE